MIGTKIVQPHSEGEDSELEIPREGENSFLTEEYQLS
jgi:hypothetical protein